jgi:hypothetical protein
MAFDVRAMENIATAPASRKDRIVAAWVAGGILIAFVALVPFSTAHYVPTAAFVPAVLSAAVLAQILTAVLFYVQYRVARQSQLALLSLAYASAAVLTLSYMLTFPHVFSPTGLVTGTHASAFFNRAILPLNIVTALAAMLMLAASGLRTVTQTWLTVVALLYFCQTLANSAFSGTRYSLGWYGGLPSALRAPDALAESGRGLHLVRELADDMTIESNPAGGTSVHVRWRSLAARSENLGRS